MLRSRHGTSVLLALAAFVALAAFGGSTYGCSGTAAPVDAGPGPGLDAAPSDAAPDASPDAPTDSGGLDASLDAPVEAGPVVCGTDRLRVMAGNLSGTGGTYDDERGIHLFRGLHPDVALVQELRYGDNSVAAQRAFVDAAFGPSFSYVRGPIVNGSDIPNGVVSRYPILDSGDWVDPYVGNRTFVWARIDVPGPADLYAISVHLLTTNATEREGEAEAIVGQVRSLPAGSLVVLAGDFNTSSRTESSVATLAQAFVTQGPYPVDQAGNANTNTTRARPYDWVLATPTLDPCQVPVLVGSGATLGTFPSGLVFDSRVYTPLTDVSPVELSDSNSPLQHMAVVREFTLPK